MKLADPANPVRSSWFADQGFRLGPGPYVSDGYAARKFLERFPRTETLADVTGGRIFRPGISRRNWTTDPEYGVPFLSSADIFQSDLASLAMITEKSFAEIPDIALQPGWTLITRSGMTAGRVTYSRLDMDGHACSEHVIRAAPDPGRITAGYLYTFLSSSYSLPVIKGAVYGTSVKHIEPPHLANLPIPRIGEAPEREINSLFQRAMKLRTEFQIGITEASRDLFESAGLAHILDYRWHDHPRDIDFSVASPSITSLRALNFSPRAKKISAALRSVDHLPLGDICRGGSLKTGSRFKRIDSDSINGVRLIGQRQAFWMRPEGRWINPHQAPADIRQDDETVLIAAHGTLGDTEVYSRCIFVAGRWLSNVYSQDFVRVRPGMPGFSSAYLYAFLRSEAAFRMMRSMSVGGKQQEYHPVLLRELPVPTCSPTDRERIASKVRLAHKQRDEADDLEDRAQELLDTGIRAMAR